MQLRAGGYRLPKDHTPVCGKIHSPKVIFGGLKSFKMKYIPKKKKPVHKTQRHNNTEQ
jgi:hypothetical protein